MMKFILKLVMVLLLVAMSIGEVKATSPPYAIVYENLISDGNYVEFNVELKRNSMEGIPLSICFDDGIMELPLGVERYERRNDTNHFTGTADPPCEDIGEHCDDANPCTIDDVYDANCNCAGTPLPEGECNMRNNNNGPCNGNVGESCNDNDPCTTNDVWVTTCNCEGVFLGPPDCVGVCGGYELPGTPCGPTHHGMVWDDNCNCVTPPEDCEGVVGGDAMPGTPCGPPGSNMRWDVDCICLEVDCTGITGGSNLTGTACDDGDACTSGDVYDNDCNCVGTPLPDDCNGVCGGNAVQGTACDDGDACTENDVYDETCVCVGEPLTEDCLGVCGGSNLPGMPCDDNDPTTTDTFWDENCNCTPYDCEGVFGGDALLWTPCDDGDPCTDNTVWLPGCICDKNPALPNRSTNCDDGNPCTLDELDEHCNCVHTLLPDDCAGVCGGSTWDGDACNDGDPCTIDDVYDNDCNCVGIPLLEDCNGVCGGTALPDSACDDNDASTINDTLNANCDCVGDKLGCTDIAACNYNPTAVIDNGSCDYGNPNICNNDCTQGPIETWDANTCTCVPGTTPIEGCTNPNYCEYNPNANCDDGSCQTSRANPWTCNTNCNLGDLEEWDPNTCQCIVTEPTIPGCPNSNYCEYDPNANCNDGSCQTLNLDIGACDDGDCTNGLETWNENTCSCQSNPPTGVQGCTDPAYCEYDPAADCDNGSCQTLKADPGTCSDGDCTNGLETWNENTCSCESNPPTGVQGCTDPNYCEYNPSADCDNGSCQTLNADPGTCDDGNCANGLETWDENTCSCVSNPPINLKGCTDPNYCEYDPTASCDDGSCQTLNVDPGTCDDGNCANGLETWNTNTCSCQSNPPSGVTGCTDPTYCEYNPNADCDDGSCQTLNADPGTCDDGNCANGFEEWDPTLCTCIVNPPTLGCTNPAYCEYNPNADCDNGSCQTLKADPGTCSDGDCTNGLETWNANTCSCESNPPSGVSGCTNPNYCEYNPNASCDDGSCQTLNADPGTCNTDCTAGDLEVWNPVTCSCVFDAAPVLGCTNPNAVNYNANATCDDGSCDTTCPDDGSCNTDCTAGHLQVWNPETCACMYASTPVLGCTDSNASNYDPAANCDDGSCNPVCDDPGTCSDGDCMNGLETWDETICSCVSNAPTGVHGCTDPNYCEFNPNADCDDGSCVTIKAGANSCNQDCTLGPIEVWENSSCRCVIYIISVLGCTDPNYCEYNPDANCDDGSCTTSITDPGTCNTNCNAGNLEQWNATTCQCETVSTPIPGCTDPTYCEYDPTATCDDGSCNTSKSDPGTCDSNPCSNAGAYVWDETSCTCVLDQPKVKGCTNPNACNYNPDAVCDDGSCLTVYGCNNPVACNYDPNVTCHEPLSCVYEGGCNDDCTQGQMTEWDEESCQCVDIEEVNGCTNHYACNYDPTATCDDGSCFYNSVCPEECIGGELGVMNDNDPILCVDENVVLGFTDLNNAYIPHGHEMLIHWNNPSPTSNPTDNYVGMIATINETLNVANNGTYPYNEPVTFTGTTWIEYPDFPLAACDRDYTLSTDIVFLAPLTLEKDLSTCTSNAIHVQASGGLPGYNSNAEYTFEVNGQSNHTGVFTNLSPGTYTVNASDTKGCTASIQVDVYEGQSMSLDVTTPTCPYGQIIIETTGGEGAWTYYLYSQGTPFDDGMSAHHIYENANATEIITLDNYLGIYRGDYTVYVKNDADCGQILNEDITVWYHFEAMQSDICNAHDQITVSASGGYLDNGYTYSLYDGATFIASNTTGEFSGVAVGDYSVMVSDNNPDVGTEGCTISVPVTVVEPISISYHYNACDEPNEVTITHLSGGAPTGDYEVIITSQYNSTYPILNYYGTQYLRDYISPADLPYTIDKVPTDRTLYITVLDGSVDPSLTNYACRYSIGPFETSSQAGTPLNLSLSATGESCPYGHIDIVTSGGGTNDDWTYYVYPQGAAFDNGVSALHIENIAPSSVSIDLEGGDYTIYGINAADCSQVLSADVSSYAPLEFEETSNCVTGDFTITTTGGYPSDNYVYILTQNDSEVTNNTTGVFTDIPPGDYELFVSDGNPAIIFGCIITKNITVGERVSVEYDYDPCVNPSEIVITSLGVFSGNYTVFITDQPNSTTPIQDQNGNDIAAYLSVADPPYAFSVPIGGTYYVGAVEGVLDNGGTEACIQAGGPINTSEQPTLGEIGIVENGVDEIVCDGESIQIGFVNPTSVSIPIGNTIQIHYNNSDPYANPSSNYVGTLNGANGQISIVNDGNYPFNEAVTFTATIWETYPTTPGNACNVNLTSTDLVFLEPISITNNAETCTDGIDVSATGGLPAYDASAGYTYGVLNQTNNLGQFIGLDVGAYTVTVTDAQACASSISVEVTAQTPDATLSAISPPCSNEIEFLLTTDNSEIWTFYVYHQGVAFDTGNTIYMANGYSNQAFSLVNLEPGAYTVYALNEGECAIPLSQDVVIEGTLEVQQANFCEANQVTVEVVEEDDLSGYTFTLYDGTTEIASNNTGVFNADAGDYTVEISQGACTATLPVSVTAPIELAYEYKPCADPTQLIITGITGGNPSGDYTVTIRKYYDILSPTPISPHTIVDLSGADLPYTIDGLLPETMYSIVITDGQTDPITGQLCQTLITFETESPTLGDIQLGNCTNIEESIPGIDFEIIHPTGSTCDGGIGVVNTGPNSTPYEYTWSNEMARSSIQGLCAGDYSVTVVDAFGCMSVKVFTLEVCTDVCIEMEADYADIISCEQRATSAIDIEVTEPLNVIYTYEWSNGVSVTTCENTNSLTGITAGTYCVTITASTASDGSGTTCEKVECFEIEHIDCSPPDADPLPPIIVNEFSQAADKEFIELLVLGDETCNPVDIRGFIVDDNDGTFTDQHGEWANTGISSGHVRFKDISRWEAVPKGSLILLYNPARRNPKITLANDPDDQNGDKVYILPITEGGIEGAEGLPSEGRPMTYQPLRTVYQSNTTWSVLDIDEENDAVQVRYPDGSYCHGISFGPLMDPIYTSVRRDLEGMIGGPDSLHISENSYDFFLLKTDDYLNSVGYQGANNGLKMQLINETPGRPNTSGNISFVSDLKADCTTIDPIDIDITQLLPSKPKTSGENTTLEGIHDVNVYPLPFSEGIHVEFENQGADSYEVQIYDILGAAVYKKSYHAASGTNKVYLSFGNRLPSGIYTLRLQDNLGRITVKKLSCTHFEP